MLRASFIKRVDCDEIDETLFEFRVKEFLQPFLDLRT
jgi:hypothetical protein